MQVHPPPQTGRLRGLLALSALATSLVLVGAPTALAAVPVPQVEGPVPVTDASHPFSGAATQTTPINLAKYGYVEEEYYVSGNANVYEIIPYSDYETNVLRSGPYTTRILVRRPKNMRNFSGDVAVEIMNMSAQFDVPFDWGAMWKTIVKQNDIWVGITGKPNVLPALESFDADRYEPLSWENPLPPDQQTCGSLPGDLNYDPNLSKLYENGLAWDMFSQVGRLVRSGGASNPLGREAADVYLLGESQSANYLIRYYKWIAQDALLPNGKPVFDGYLFQDASNVAPTAAGTTVLHQCEAPLPADDPQRTLVPGKQPLVGELSQNFYSRGPVTLGRPANVNTKNQKFWLWALTGVGHENQWMFDTDPNPQDIAATGVPFEFPHVDCGPDKPEPGFDMVEGAMWTHLKRWVATGKAPPAAPDPAVQNGQYVLDADGNVLGGLRLPERQVPAARYTGHFLLSRDDNCAESIVPFSQSRLDELYSSHQDYVAKYTAATRELVADGFVLPDKAREMIKEAKARPIP